jgi:single-strand DNA-binding protein
MNSFTLTAVGQLARNPELVAKGDTAYTRFCMVGNDYAGKDEEGAAREVVTTLWFVAFGALGEAIARNSRKGDQLIVEARVRANNWTDKQGEKQYDHSFVVQGFRFGAPGRTKREERDARREDGHGFQRPEARANGHDRSANNGAYASSGATPSVVADARAVSRSNSGGTADSGAPGRLNSGASVGEDAAGCTHSVVAGDAGAAADTDLATAEDSSTGAATDSGAAADWDAPARADDASRVASNVEKVSARHVANTSVAASRATQKAGSNRSARRASVSAA